jgi:hypothetical protein
VIVLKENPPESGNSRDGGLRFNAGNAVGFDESIANLRACCQIRTYSEAEKIDILRRHGVQRVKDRENVGTERSAQRTENFATYTLGIPYGGRADLMPPDMQEMDAGTWACLKLHNSAQRKDGAGCGEIEGNSGYVRLRILGGTARGGGVRKAIKGYSKKSRLNLRSELNRVEWNAIDNSKVFMITLTYEGIPSDGRIVMDDLGAFRRRLDRWSNERQIDYGAVWIKEFQRRGSVHFHLLVVFSDLLRGDFRFHRDGLIKFVSRAWHEITGSSDKGLRAGTRVEGVRRSAIGYMMRYMGKDYQKNVPPDFKNVGRFWGFWYKENMSYRYDTVRIDLESAWRLRRILWGLLALRGCSVPVRGKGSRNGVFIYNIDSSGIFNQINGGDADSLGGLRW